jgi:hypothetical protein
MLAKKKKRKERKGYPLRSCIKKFYFNLIFPLDSCFLFSRSRSFGIRRLKPQNFADCVQQLLTTNHKLQTTSNFFAPFSPGPNGRKTIRQTTQHFKLFLVLALVSLRTSNFVLLTFFSLVSCFFFNFLIRFLPALKGEK